MLPARTAEALSSYRFFETKSSLPTEFDRRGIGAMERVGRKKSPRALMARWAKAGDHFFEIFFGSFFPSTGKKLNIHLLRHPTAIGLEVP